MKLICILQTLADWKETTQLYSIIYTIIPSHAVCNSLDLQIKPLHFRLSGFCDLDEEFESTSDFFLRFTPDGAT